MECANHKCVDKAEEVTHLKVQLTSLQIQMYQKDQKIKELEDKLANKMRRIDAGVCRDLLGYCQNKIFHRHLRVYHLLAPEPLEYTGP